MLEIKGLTKRFGALTAVDHISFALARGEVLGFLGPNGAGKSTTMRMVTGFLPPTEGTAAVCGFDVVERPIEVKRRIGYLPEGAPLYGDMTPAGLLRFIAGVRRLDRETARRRTEYVVERLQLGEFYHRPIETLSKGFKRRVGLAQALLHDPDVLILDEPTDGLDPNQKHEVRTLLGELAGEKAIVISTHILEEVEAVCGRAIIIARGRVVADSKPQELQARSARHNAVNLRVDSGQAPTLAERLAGLPQVERVERLGELNGSARLLAIPRDGHDIADHVRATVAGNGVREFYVERGRLDDVFRALTAEKERAN